MEYDSNRCTSCRVHFSTWHPDHGGNKRQPEVMPEWVWCLPCQEREVLTAQGPPAGKDAKGWHIEFRQQFYDN